MTDSDPKFTWISLGVEGGLNESNLNCHMLAPFGSTEYVCLDAGTLLYGLNQAAEKGVFEHIDVSPFPESTLEQVILHHHIKAYLITHCYLDHIHGLVQISPNENPKPVISLSGIIDDLRDCIFNWRAWPNMGNEGKEPYLGAYQYMRLKEGEKYSIKNTAMQVTAYPLSHDLSTDSAAFLVETNNNYILYMGDTGPDEVEKRDTTEQLWKIIAPIIKKGNLRALYIEASYRDDHPDELLYGHLTPKWIMDTLYKLAKLVDPNNSENALKDLNVIIGHIKPDEYLNMGRPIRGIIRDQLNDNNNLGINFILPRQGSVLDL